MMKGTMVDTHELDPNIVDVINKHKPSEVEITKTVTLKTVDTRRLGEQNKEKVTKTLPSKKKALKKVKVAKKTPTLKKKRKRASVKKRANVKKTGVRKGAKKVRSVTTKTTVTKRTAGTKTLRSGVSKLTSVVKELVSLFKDIKKDKKKEHDKILRRLEELETQNQKLARGILAVADLVSKQTDLIKSKQLEQPLQAVQQDSPKPQAPTVHTDDLSLPGKSAFPQDRLPERRPLFLDKMPSFTRQGPPQGPPQGQQGLPMGFQPGQMPPQGMQPQPFPQQDQPVIGPEDMGFPKPIQTNAAPAPPFENPQQPEEPQQRQEGQPEEVSQ